MGRMVDEEGCLLYSDADDAPVEFEPCAMVLADPTRTEVVLKDTLTVWVTHSASVDLGYDGETNELIAVRIHGDVLKRDLHK